MATSRRVISSAHLDDHQNNTSTYELDAEAIDPSVVLYMSDTSRESSQDQLLLEELPFDANKKRDQCTCLTAAAGKIQPQQDLSKYVYLDGIRGIAACAYVFRIHLDLVNN